MAITSNIQIVIDLNELVAIRGDYLFKDDDVSMTENQIDHIAETLRHTLTWDTLYHMVDSSILEFYDCHEHPEIWDPHYGETAGDEPAKSFEAEQKRKKKEFDKNFEMVTLSSSSWEIQVPRRKSK
tara:strand:- start:521 stop:898 length:378 start_codon:yes stop_codon:yes gene_type:complete